MAKLIPGKLAIAVLEIHRRIVCDHPHVRLPTPSQDIARKPLYSVALPNYRSKDLQGYRSREILQGS